MRILWLRNEDNFRVAAHLWTTMSTALGALVEVETLTRYLDGPWGQAVQAAWVGDGPQPAALIQDPAWASQFDAIILETGGLFHMEPWDQIDAPVVMIWGDNHREKIARWMKDAPRYVDLFLPLLADSFQRLHPVVADSVRWEWFPWWIDPEMFYDRQMPLIFDVLSTGSLDKNVYKVRTAAAAACQGLPAFHRVDRPDDFAKGDRWPMGADYANLINSAAICLSCTGAWKYGLGKCYEIPAVRSVLASDHCSDMAAMGHVPGETFLEIDADNVREQVMELLSDSPRLHRIADAGHDLIHECYEVQDRAQALVALLEAL